MLFQFNSPQKKRSSHTGSNGKVAHRRVLSSHGYSGWKIRQRTSCTENNCRASLLCELSCVVVMCLAERRTSSTENNFRASLLCGLSCDAVETRGWRMSRNNVHRHEVSLLLRLFLPCNWMLKLLCIRVLFLVRVLSEYESRPGFYIIKIQKNIATFSFSVWSSKEAFTLLGEQKGLQI